MISPYLFISDSFNKGRGVFTSEAISQGTVIEISPVIVMSKKERLALDQTLLHDYIFEWGGDKNRCCLALGYISVYNHSYQSNCEYEMDYKEEMISIKTMRFIKAGEELYINYNGNWDDKKTLWFEAK
ncbi:MAG TPA: SET domain-containing protein [Puia sp.]|jgi:SET domain-containing protein|nr:SET domain-containing protein [Puia sp.]